MSNRIYLSVLTLVLTASVLIYCRSPRELVEVPIEFPAYSDEWPSDTIHDFELSPEATAPEWDQAREQMALTLAKVAAHEAGIWRGQGETPNDMGAIFQVIRNRAPYLETDWNGAAEIYSGCSLRVCRGDRNPWVAGLSADGVEPAHWPSSVQWSGVRGHWLAHLARARDIVRGDSVLVCDHSPDHWGSRAIPGDRARADRAIAAGRWIHSRCPNTRNGFYTVVRRNRPGSVDL